jgi:hypothetical protein
MRGRDDKGCTDCFGVKNDPQKKISAVNKITTKINKLANILFVFSKKSKNI